MIVAVLATVGLTGAALYGNHYGRQAATVALGGLAAMTWLSQIKADERVRKLVDLVWVGVRTINRGTALAEYTEVQTTAANVVQRYANETTNVAVAAIKALAHHDPDLAGKLSELQLDAVAELEEHLPDMEAAVAAWLAKDDAK